VVRVIITTILGYLFALPIPRLLVIDLRLGAVGLSATAGFAAWVEFLLLRRGMNKRIGKIDASISYFLRLWIAAVLSAGVAWAIKLFTNPHRPIVTAIAVLIPYGLAYLLMTTALGIDQAASLARRFSRATARFGG